MTIRNLLLAVSLACAPAWADILTVNLDSTQLTASPGGSITFSGTITNNDSATVDLNNLSVSLTGALFSVDITPFFKTAPLTVAGSPQTANIDYFTVTVDTPYTDPLGVVDGTLTILGGVEGPGGYDPTTQDFLGSAAFSVNVNAVPEPSAFTLLVIEAGLVLLGRRWMGRSS